MSQSFSFVAHSESFAKNEQIRSVHFGGNKRDIIIIIQAKAIKNQAI